MLHSNFQTIKNVTSLQQSLTVEVELYKASFQDRLMIQVFEYPEVMDQILIIHQIILNSSSKH